MKKLIVAAIFPWLLTIFGHSANAQDTPKPETKKETQEIVIRKKGDKDVTLNVQITGDKVIVNGKPLVEFKDDEISINNRKIIINGQKITREINGAMNGIGNLNFDDFEGLASVKPRPFLGVATEKTDDGAKIISVTKESAAEIAGLQKDDIITKINDTKVTGPDDLFELINKMKAKDEIKVTYKRGDKKEKTVKATLKETKSVDVRSFSITTPDGGVRAFGFPRNPAMPPNPDGFSFNNNDREIFINGYGAKKPKLGIKIQDLEEGTGVKILDVDAGSPAATAGVLKDDILTELNGQKIANTDEAREQLKINADVNNYPLKVKRNGTEMTLNIKIPKKLKTADL